MAFLDSSGITRLCADLKTRFQEKLVSGSNIKTINNSSILGSGNLSIASLPAVTSSDNGKVLRVVSGAWAAASLPSANGVSF